VNDAVMSFARDLRDPGASESDISDLSRLYDRALTNPSDSGWEQFYRATFAVACRTLGQAVPQSREAVASIVRLLEDDLGTALFGRDLAIRRRSGDGVRGRLGDFLADAEALLVARLERVSPDDIARLAQPNPLHPQQGAHHDG
jgi:hypothetical protein